MKIIKIGALWCSGCLITNKAINQIKKEYSNIEIKELDVDFDEEECRLYHYEDILPVLIFEKENKEIKRLVGEISYEQLKNEIESSED